MKDELGKLNRVKKRKGIRNRFNSFVEWNKLMRHTAGFKLKFKKERPTCSDLVGANNLKNEKQFKKWPRIK